MKHLLLIIILLLVNCNNKENIRLDNRTKNGSQLVIVPIDNDQEESIKTELLVAPLILDGKPYVNSSGKSYREDEAYLFEYLGCNFDSDATIRWHSFEGIEQLFNLKKISVYGENLATIDFTPLLSLYNLVELFVRGNITRLPDLSGLKKLSSITIEGSQLESFEGIGSPNVRRIRIGSDKKIDSLAPLNNLVYLEDLEIYLPRKTEYKIADMINLPNLKLLEAYIGKIDLKGIENLIALEHLRLDYCEPFSIDGIGKLTNLKELSINLISPNPSLEFLRGLPNITSLTLYADSCRDFFSETEAYQVLDLSPLATLRNLHNLKCENFIVKNVSALDTLESLSNDWSNYIFLNRCRLYDETEKSKHRLVFEYPHE
jgi:hypothetical protein